MNNKSLVILIFACVIFIFNLYYSPEKVTGSVWEPKVWNLDNGSNSTYEGGLLKVYALKLSDTDFGSASIQQGEMPHRWYSSYAKMNEEITVYKDKDEPLYLIATVKRMGAIYWTTQDTGKRWNNIGLDIMGDVGLDYNSTDVSHPHALIIDFYHDTDAIKPFYYQGAGSHDMDYRAGYPLAPSRLEMGKEYWFKTRIDDKIRDALNHYGFDHFTIRYTEYYIEAKASGGSAEIRDIAIIKEKDIIFK